MEPVVKDLLTNYTLDDLTCMAAVYNVSLNNSIGSIVKLVAEKNICNRKARVKSRVKDCVKSRVKGRMKGSREERLAAYKRQYYGIHPQTRKTVPKINPKIYRDYIPKFKKEHVILEPQSRLPTKFPLDLVLKMADRSEYNRLQRNFTEFIEHLVATGNFGDDVVFEKIGNPTMIENPPESSPLYWSDPVELALTIVRALHNHKKTVVIELIYKTGPNTFHYNIVTVSILDQHTILIDRFDPNGWTSKSYWSDTFDLYFRDFIFKVEELVMDTAGLRVDITLLAHYDACPFIGPQGLLKCEEWAHLAKVWSENVKLGLCALWSLLYAYLKLFPENAGKRSGQIFDELYQDLDYSGDALCSMLLGFLEYGLAWQNNQSVR